MRRGRGQHGAERSGSRQEPGGPERRALTLDGLRDRLRAALDTRRERTVFVRVAAGVDYARVIDALDAAQGCGAERIGLVGR